MSLTADVEFTWWHRFAPTRRWHRLRVTMEHETAERETGRPGGWFVKEAAVYLAPWWGLANAGPEDYYYLGIAGRRELEAMYGPAEVDRIEQHWDANADPDATDPQEDSHEAV